MVFLPEHATFSLQAQSLMAKATQFLGSVFHGASPAPEATDAFAHFHDARLAPRVPMQKAELTVSTQAQLENIGLRPGKRVTEQTHPELFAAWQTMAQRAGMPHAPQLMVVQSPALNAFTISPHNDVAITSGALQTLDLRETVALLGHELGHASSQHPLQRVGFGAPVAAITGGLGFALVNPTRMRAVGEKLGQGGALARASGAVLRWVAHPYNLLGHAVAAAATFAAGYAGWAVSNQWSVRHTELDADRKGALISGDPEGLVMMLQRLHSVQPKPGFWGKIWRRQGYPSIEARVEQMHSMVAKQPSLQNPVLGQVLTNPTAPVADIPTQAPQAQVQHVALAERVGSPVAAPALA